MPRAHDDAVTREERLAELLEEFRAAESSKRMAVADITARARVARDRAEDACTQGADAAERAFRAAQKIRAK